MRVRRIFVKNLYKLGIIPADIRRKMDISCIDKISEAVIKLVLIKGHLLEKKNLCQPIKKLRNFDIVQ